MSSSFDTLAKRAKWLRKETIRLHSHAPQTRLASSLSCIELLTSLYYGDILKFDPKQPFSEDRDRFIISKGHGSVAMYPLLADLGFFDKKELERTCKVSSFLGSIPDPMVPGYETINGSLGQGLSVACGMAIALKNIDSKNRVFVLSGDGELNEGSVWEAVMFAGHNKLGGLVMIIDNNKKCMLDFCANIIDLEPLEEKFLVYKWKVIRINGHDIKAIMTALKSVKKKIGRQPTVIIADTIKGKGVSILENDPLCHIRSLTNDEARKALGE